MTAEKKNGFTIVELMVVIAIIAILAGAITMGLNGMFYKSRMGRAMALRNIMQSGLETYYAQQGDWPGKLKDLAVNPQFDPDRDYYTLAPEDVDGCFKEVVDQSWGKSKAPVMDVSGLYLIEKGKLRNKYGCTDIHKSWDKARSKHVVATTGLPDRALDHECKNCPRGRDFAEATKKGAASRVTGFSSIAFGYPGPNNGRFCRFRVLYYPKSDTVKVLLQRATEYNDLSRKRDGYVDE